VVADPDLLRTLAKREFRSGLYEVVKYGVIWSRTLFDHLRAHHTAIVAHDPAALLPAIVQSADIKAEVVSKDEREGGLRRVLNFGHTIGHALEAVTNYRRFRHGEAIAYGMLGAADISERRGVMPEADRTALADLIAALGPLPAVSDLSAQAVLEAAHRDGHGRHREPDAFVDGLLDPAGDDRAGEVTVPDEDDVAGLHVVQRQGDRPVGPLTDLRGGLAAGAPVRPHQPVRHRLADLHGGRSLVVPVIPFADQRIHLVDIEAGKFGGHDGALARAADHVGVV